MHQAETEDIKETDYKFLFCFFLEKLGTVEKASISITAKIKEDFCNAEEEQLLRNTIVFIFSKRCLQLGDCSLNLHKKSCKMSTAVYHSVLKCGLVFFLFHFAIRLLELRDCIKQYVHRRIWLICLVFHVTVLFLNSVLFHASSAAGKGVQMNSSTKIQKFQVTYEQLLKVFNFHTHRDWPDTYHFCSLRWWMN